MFTVETKVATENQNIDLPFSLTESKWKKLARKAADGDPLQGLYDMCIDVVYQQRADALREEALKIVETIPKQQGALTTISDQLKSGLYRYWTGDSQPSSKQIEGVEKICRIFYASRPLQKELESMDRKILNLLGEERGDNVVGNKTLLEFFQQKCGESLQKKRHCARIAAYADRLATETLAAPSNEKMAEAAQVIRDAVKPIPIDPYTFGYSAQQSIETRIERIALLLQKDLSTELGCDELDVEIKELLEDRYDPSFYKKISSHFTNLAYPYARSLACTESRRQRIERFAHL